MATVNVNFDLSHQPNPITLNLQVQLNRGTLTIVPVDIPRVVVIAIPRYSGGVLDKILSTILAPIANIIAGSLGMFASDIFRDKSFDVFHVPNMSFNAPGMTITLKPANLSLGDFNGMLMIGGDIEIS
ncbi:hypothetical protein [Mucilaginibacter celer]|uniref:DUF4403 family protein n=1 Tax=Mucilaginibacter celer TaxID=2305508 RepID=A0A494VPF1_9SPHI|nr:hypothetical protein [Mucilaginibacter celer]AYL96149.1 hypothetical protein HYN43_012985 [Mucilaginibacter celer]